MTPEELRAYVGRVVALRFDVKDCTYNRRASTYGRLTVVDGPMADLSSDHHRYLVTVEQANTWFLPDNADIEVRDVYPAEP